MISYNPIIQNLKNGSVHGLDVLRLDLINKEISGNKWFKLKYNLEKAIQENKDTIITFGGPFSNHIAATAGACKMYKLKCIGIIRGEQSDKLNPTLKQAEQNGMQLHFVNRELYSSKNEEDFRRYLEEKFGRHYLIPEGGNNKEGVLGCMEIIDSGLDYDYILCACGTATTYAGILAGKKRNNQKIIGISVLKGENKLPAEVQAMLTWFPGNETEIMSNEALQKQFIEDNCIINCYSFKGYAKTDEQLLNFKKEFELKYKIPLDHVYTVKLMYGVFDLIKQNKLKPDTKVLVVHSGGLQGNKGFEARYRLNSGF